MTKPEHIRNISIIAHIDHGKTTLTDRLMLATQTITAREFHDRLLDSNPIEQERGITIKLAPVTMKRSLDNQLYTINLIDTPGHVDFSYEVSRSLAACEGAVLLIDATQGIQAQTLSNLDKARALGLTILVALNKIDLPAAEPTKIIEDITHNLDIPEEHIIQISAKTGYNIDALFEHIITKIPAPQIENIDTFKALVFNSIYHPHKGVVAFIKTVSGQLQAGDELVMLAGKQTFEAKEIGIFTPGLTKLEKLYPGQVGFIATGLKSVAEVKAGDTITQLDTQDSVSPLRGYQEPQPMVYMDLYPTEGKDFDVLKDGIEKIALNDASLQYTKVSSLALGNGFRVGFLGALHAEVVLERIKREYNLELIPTAPTVVYKVTTTADEEIVVNNPSDLPDPSQIKQISEPVAAVTIFTPEEYLGRIMPLASSEARGSLISQEYIGNRVKLEYLIPLSELIISFFDQLKSASQGYASLEYSLFDYQPVDVVKLSILINKEPVEALAQIVVRERAQFIGKRVTAKLKEAIPRQLFEIPIQAAVGGTVVARETVKAFRKDVTAKLYGGDITRRKKLLEKQKKGKAKRSQFAKVEIPQEAYLAVLKQ